MADTSAIEWTDATWNPVTGCSVVSPGCTNCYAMKLAGTRLQHHPSRAGLTRETKAGPVWTGEVRFNEQWLTQPIEWKAPRRIFVCAHGDLFHEAVPDDWIDQVFAIMALSPRHTFQVLTKRPDRIRAYMNEKWQGTPAQVIAGLSIPAGGPTGRMVRVKEACEPLLDRFKLADPDRNELWTEAGKCKAMQWGWPLPNVWLGVSVEDQTRADERIPDLLRTPAAKRFLSCEPLLGPINLERIQCPVETPADDVSQGWKFDALQTGDYCEFQDSLGVWAGGDGPNRSTRIDWVICGGESGPGARPMHPDWARQLRDQCQDAGVPFFFKQWGEFQPASYGIFGHAMHWQDQPGRWVDGLGNIDRHTMVRVGKKVAGALLDRREWREMPK